MVLGVVLWVVLGVEGGLSQSLGISAVTAQWLVKGVEGVGGVGGDVCVFALW